MSFTGSLSAFRELVKPILLLKHLSLIEIGTCTLRSKLWLLMTRRSHATSPRSSRNRLRGILIGTLPLVNSMQGSHIHFLTRRSSLHRTAGPTTTISPFTEGFESSLDQGMSRDSVPPSRHDTLAGPEMTLQT